jgi:hypothetical protein
MSGETDVEKLHHFSLSRGQLPGTSELSDSGRVLVESTALGGAEHGDASDAAGRPCPSLGPSRSHDATPLPERRFVDTSHLILRTDDDIRVRGENLAPSDGIKRVGDLCDDERDSGRIVFRTNSVRGPALCGSSTGERWTPNKGRSQE